MDFIDEAAEHFKITDSLLDKGLAEEYRGLQARCEGSKRESQLDNLLLYHTRKVIVQRFLKKYEGLNE